MPKQWITTDVSSGSGYWHDYTPQTKDVAMEKLFASGRSPLLPDAGTTPKMSSANGVPQIEFVSGGKTYYMQPALGLGRENGVQMGDNGIEQRTDYSVDPTYWQSYSNDDRWSGNVAGLPTMRADWAKSLVDGSPYATGGADFAGGGWVSEKPIPRQDWQAAKDESFLSAFMGGPMSVIGPALGISSAANFLSGGAFSSGLGSLFGGGGAAFNPALDFGADYFSGAGNFSGNAASAASGGGMDWWSELGLNASDVGLESAGNFTTNPSFSDLTSGAFNAGDMGYDLSGMEGMSSYDANGNLINLNPLQQLYSTLQNVPNFPGRDTLIKQLMSGAAGGSGTDIGKLLAGLGTAGLGMYGSNQQAKSLMDIANQARADRQPYLNASLSYLANPDSYFAGPGKSAMDATLRGLSASVGNPIGSPTAMGIATQAGMQDWRNAVTGFGNMGLAGQDLRASLQSNAAQADANGLNALGYGLNSVLNPQPNVTDIIKALNAGGLA